VRKAAVILLSDFPTEKATKLIEEHSGDEAADVRIGAANAIGFGQFAELLPVLDRMLKDEDIHVRTAAALSIVSFAPAEAEKVLKANINDPDFTSVFVNALAEKNPEPYLDYLAEIIEKRLEPRYFWGGSIPWWVSRKILSDYLASPRGASLEASRREKYLSVIEKSKAER
jgi:HEAT repeat protein